MVGENDAAVAAAVVACFVPYCEVDTIQIAAAVPFAACWKKPTTCELGVGKLAAWCSSPTLSVAASLA